MLYTSLLHKQAININGQGNNYNIYFKEVNNLQFMVRPLNAGVAAAEICLSNSLSKMQSDQGWSNDRTQPLHPG